MDKDLMKKLEVIKKSSEILLEHYETRGFKNSLIEIGLKNILAISQEAIDEIKEEKASEPLRE